MTRRVLVLALLLAAALAAPAGAAELRLSEAAGSRFPDRSYALTLAHPMRLTAAQVQVSENGRAVRGVSLSQATGAEARRFGVVLAIDTSGSMHGRPLEAALRATRAFVSHRNPSQPVAVVTFAGQVHVVQDFTTDAAAIDRALQAVGPEGGGSRILDAAARSVELIRAAKMPSGSAVILSDGADRRSQTPADEVAAAATSANARVYTIGLQSRSSDFGTLNLLAAGTRAEFSAATSLMDLARVYERLGSRLTHQYVLRYRSTAGPSRHVRVAVRLAGHPWLAEVGYTTPALSRSHGAPFRHSSTETVWLSSGVALAIAVVVAVLVVLALFVLLRPRTASLRRRLASYVGAEEPEEDVARRAAMPSGRLRQGAGRSLEKARWWPNFIEMLDIGRVKIAPERLVAWVAVATLALLALLTFLTGKPIMAVFALGVPLAVRAALKRRVAKQRKLFVEQLPDNLQVMASAMRAGHSFSGALSVVVAEAPEPTHTELARVVADEHMGVPVDTALAGVVRRMDSKDLEQVALVATLQRETGGNTAEVLERVTQTIRDRLALRRMVQSLTAQGRMSRWVLTALPLVLLAAISVLNPTYIRPLFTEPVGQLVLGVAALMVFCGSLVIGKIVDIKV
jgi:tight adherence protein B